MQMEKYFQIKKAAKEPYQAVPEQSLAATIIYTLHYLRWPEYMGLTEFLHPFRFIFRARDTDPMAKSACLNNNSLVSPITVIFL